MARRQPRASRRQPATTSAPTALTTSARRTLQVGCAPAGKVLASLGHFPREALLERERWVVEPWHRTARGAGSSEPDRIAGSHPPRSSGCWAQHHCGLIAPGYATCRRSRFRVINPQVRPSFWRLPQPIRRLLLLAHPSDLELPGVDLLPHQGQANSLALRALRRERQTNTLTSVTRRPAYLAIQTGATRFLAARPARAR